MKKVRGTHFLVADEYSYAHVHTDEQTKLIDMLMPAEMDRKDEIMLCCRIEALNTSMVPRYAWFKGLTPNGEVQKDVYDKSTGFSSFESGRIFCISKLNGVPIPDKEFSILVKPGESAIYEFYVPHRPFTKEQAESFAKKSFDTLLDDCREFWNKKLEACAEIKLPEKVVDEMIRAGLLHLDLVQALLLRLVLKVLQ
jgi:hypothetical protein